MDNEDKNTRIILIVALVIGLTMFVAGFAVAHHYDSRNYFGHSYSKYHGRTMQKANINYRLVRMPVRYNSVAIRYITNTSGIQRVTN